MDAAMCVLRCFGLRAATEFMSGRGKRAERLAKCMSETGEEGSVVCV